METPPKKFTKEIKQNWIDALKSGKYKQGFDALYTKEENSYCCIGVLACVTDGLSVVYEEKNENPYNFLNTQIGKSTSDMLWKENDDLNYRQTRHRDYRNVIPLIEKLETQD